MDKFYDALDYKLMENQNKIRIMMLLIILHQKFKKQLSNMINLLISN